MLADDGIDAELLAAVDAPTGRALIAVADDGENFIVVVPGANATVTADAVPHCRVLLAQLEVPVDAVGRALATARERGAITVLNPAPAAAVPPELLAACDIVVPNEHELELMGGVDALLDAGCRAVVVTLGGAGVAVHDRGGERRQPPFSVDVVDTTGAGDAFSGSLAARLAGGDDLDDAVRWAAAAGGLATTVAGAVPAQPSADAIRELLSRPVTEP